MILHGKTSKSSAEAKGIGIDTLHNSSQCYDGNRNKHELKILIHPKISIMRNKMPRLVFTLDPTNVVKERIRLSLR